MNGSPLERDTIAAVSTPPGRGGIAVVRMSGNRALEILRGIFTGAHDPGAHPRTMLYGFLHDGGETVDECLACWFRAPRTYTGEEMAEIHVHGGAAAAEAALSIAIGRGARPAEPGEFTRRAFLNGRIDLARAEAVMEIVAAENREHLLCAERLLAGEFSRRIESLLKEITATYARIELNIDFSDQAAGTTNRDEIAARIVAIAATVGDMIGTHRTASRIRNGVNVAVAGRVNAGKSSLFNAILGRKRAIIHERPGTTRDWISERIELEGHPINLIDTAGLRETDDDIEREGIRETERILRNADIVLYLLSPGEREIPAGFPAENGTAIFAAVGKSDLSAAPDIPSETLRVSSLTGEGIPECRALIARTAGAVLRTSDPGSLVLVERHHRHLVLAKEHLERARASTERWSEEITAFELRAAERELSAIIGRNFDGTVLDEIFRSFCIGK